MSITVELLSVTIADDTVTDSDGNHWARVIVSEEFTKPGLLPGQAEVWTENTEYNVMAEPAVEGRSRSHAEIRAAWQAKAKAMYDQDRPKSARQASSVRPQPIDKNEFKREQRRV